MNLILPTIIVIGITFSSGLAAAKTTVQDALQLTAQQPAVKKVLQRDLSLSTSPAAVLQRLRAGKKPVLVDIRHEREFNRFKIPDSINIPLHFIKTKTFLKSRPLVLVHPGRAYRRLETHCRELRGAGFDVAIMEGGLNAWRRIGGTLVGDPFAPRELTRMSPREFHYEQAYQNLVPVHIGPASDPGQAQRISRIRNVTLADAPEANGEVLNALTRCGQLDCRNASPQVSPLLIVLLDENGRKYPPLEKLAQSRGLSNLLFLEGGRKAYGDFLKQRAGAAKPRRDRTRTTGGCTACGPAAQPLQPPRQPSSTN